MLQVVRTLVSPSSPLNVTSSCQKAMNQSGLLEQLTSILMASGIPADILTETINTVAEVIRGHHNNQEFFASVNAPSTPPRPAYMMLLTSADITSITAGQLLCGGLFTGEALSNWFSAVALSHALVDNPTQKEQLLRVQLATSVGNPPVSLMQQCTTILQQGGKLPTRLGLLMLMSTWLANCTLAVMQFLNIPTSVPYLTSQVSLAEGDEHEDIVQGLCAFLLGICIEFNDDSVPSFTRDALCQLLEKRVGLETFVDKLSEAAQRPQLKYKHPSEVFFDYEFCRLFKSLEGLIIKAVQQRPKELANGPECNMSDAQHGLLQRYKGLIRDQDERIESLTSELETLHKEYTQCSSELQELQGTVQQLRDQNSLLKAQRAAVGGQGDSKSPSPEFDHTKKELEDLRKKHEELLQVLETLKDSQRGEKERTTAEVSTATMPQELPEAGDAVGKVTALEEQVASLQKELEDLKAVKEEKEKLETELTNLKKEQEDLLIMLTEQDSKINKYTTRLKELGEEVEEDDEEINFDEYD
uniref:Proteasome subunit beta type n=1 Tax=Ornithodoros moubata TaxID=6938 RepID=A0A1Z5L0I5_ORNMO